MFHVPRSQREPAEGGLDRAVEKSGFVSIELAELREESKRVTLTRHLMILLSDNKLVKNLSERF